MFIGVQKMKRFLTVIAIIFVAIILIFSLYIAVNNYMYRKDELKIFDEKAHDFYLLNNHILENYDTLPTQDRITLSADNLRLPSEVRQAFNSVKEAIAYDFSIIYITNERVSYCGLGNRMYVYSRNGKKPNYFYSKDDGVIYITYKLKDNWYLLENIAR